GRGAPPRTRGLRAAGPRSEPGRPRQSDAHVPRAVGVLRLLAAAPRLRRKHPRGGDVVSRARTAGLARRRAGADRGPLLRAVLPAAPARRETEPGDARRRRGPDPRHAARGRLLDGRARRARGARISLALRGDAAGRRRPLARRVRAAAPRRRARSGERAARRAGDGAWALIRTPLPRPSAWRPRPSS